MARFIDLDEVIPEDTTVKLGGVLYKLPGDIPTPDFLAISRAHARLTEPQETAEDMILAAEGLYERILELFQVRNPDVEKVPLGLQQAISLVYELYRVDQPAEEAVPDPPEPTAGGTRSTRKPAAKKKKTAASGS